VIESIPTDHLTYHYLAALFVQVGDWEAYRRHCNRTLQQFAGTTDPVVAERMAKDCLIVLPAAAAVEGIKKWVDTAIAAGAEHKSWDYFQFVKGLAEYRQGHFAGAVEWMQKIVNRPGDSKRTVGALMILAMAQHQIKQNAEARATLAQGLELAQNRLAIPGKGPPGEQWHDWIIAQHLMAEAKNLLKD